MVAPIPASETAEPVVQAGAHAPPGRSPVGQGSGQVNLQPGPRKAAAVRKAAGARPQRTGAKEPSAGRKVGQQRVAKGKTQGAVKKGKATPVDVAGTKVEINLLGGFQFLRDGRPVELMGGARRLVAMLALSDHPVSRSYVAGSLWPNADEMRASASLRSTLWRLRSVAPSLVTSLGATHLRLSEGIAVDLHRAKAVAVGLVRDKWTWTDSYVDRLLESGDLLPEWSAEWITIEREVYRQLRLHALEVLCEQLAEAGLHGRAVVAGLAAVNAEPLRESAHRVLIAAYIAEGNAVEALRQYAFYRKLLREEMGIEPSPALNQVVAPLRQRNPG